MQGIRENPGAGREAAGAAGGACDGSIKIDQVKGRGGRNRIEGAVPVSVLYISSDDSTPFAVIDGTVPFGHFAEVPGLDEKCRFTVLPSMEQLGDDGG